MRWLPKYMYKTHFEISPSLLFATRINNLSHTNEFAWADQFPAFLIHTPTTTTTGTATNQPLNRYNNHRVHSRRYTRWWRGEEDEDEDDEGEPLSGFAFLHNSVLSDPLYRRPTVHNSFSHTSSYHTRAHLYNLLSGSFILLSIEDIHMYVTYSCATPRLLLALSPLSAAGDWPRMSKHLY